MNIIQSNDDGWAEINIRTLFDTFEDSGANVVLSAPAENKSGSGSLDFPPTEREEPCQFDSCPAASPPVTEPAARLNYVNSFPVTSIKHGIDDVAPNYMSNPGTAIAVTGPNVGSNLNVAVFVSGTVGAATFAAHERGIAAIAFSGASGDPTPFDAPETPLYSRIYADLAVNLTETMHAASAPYLPEDTYLNVNFPEVTESRCNDAAQFEFVLTRIFPRVSIVMPEDVETCGSTTLPTETSVVNNDDGCYVSVSVGNAGSKADASPEEQAQVLDVLQGLLSCVS
ncbi:5'/3'-nucleotidase sure [Lineolata rhizophorae]|uniref:5'/3'-nucleotidase sure n=1 Tax=Lineolata rhizophorae TaxID=578093 RepID=A0A6A6P8N1_9PEZI|nr:5'/3'-nucleotidase sure [Lineolata rhizophorae]